MTEETRESSFDELAKGLASGEVSRRKALRMMGAALFGSALASIPGVALAAKGGGGNPAHGACPAGTTNCQGKCVDLQTNQNNCGQCRRVCSQGQICQGGTCLADLGSACSNHTNRCRAGLTCLAGTCVVACGPTNCPNGCCDSNNVCQPGTTPAACGYGGAPCEVCLGTERDNCEGEAQLRGCGD